MAYNLYLQKEAYRAAPMTYFRYKKPGPSSIMPRARCARAGKKAARPGPWLRDFLTFGPARLKSNRKTKNL